MAARETGAPMSSETDKALERCVTAFAAFVEAQAKGRVPPAVERELAEARRRFHEVVTRETGR